jgi:hypothetical protein
MSLENVKYSEWLINQSRLPDKTSQEYKPFFDFHKKLCLDGFVMDGVFINPFLYWHLNLWHTEVDVIDDRGRIYQKYANPTLRDNEWLVTNEIDRAHAEKRGLVILGIRRFAKALQNDELLYTPDGEISIGEVNQGDVIYGADGKLTTVTGVFPQGKIPIYKMVLEDGREILCCENHIWRVLDRRNGRSIKDLTVKELLPIYKGKRIHNGYKDGKQRITEECHFAIPNNKAVEYEEKSLPINPYFLGLWLGDGSSRRAGITTVDEEIVKYVYDYAHSLGLSVRQDNVEYIVTSGKMGGRDDKNSLLSSLKTLNLIKNKHIPSEYLHSSVEQRMELLKGLMDSDGSVYSNGTISFVTTNEQLAEGFYTLCRGLGINLSRKKFIPKLYGKPCGEGWRFTLFTELLIFKLERKLKNYKTGNKGKQSKIHYTSIRDISLVGEDYATCITVDNEDKLFLTTDYTTTHNSVLEASYIAWGATFDQNSQNVIAGLNAPDIKLITDKLDKGLNFLPEYFRWQRVEDNWKNQVTLGIKTKSGERIPFSQILIRNLDEGNNEEAIAGTKPRKLIIDEIGKGSFLRGLQAAVPGFTTPFGWGCSPILTGTGGDMKKFMDAKSLMFDVDNYNFLTYNNEDDSKRVHGLFISNKYRMEAKEASTLGDYLNSPKNSDLYNVNMQVSNEEKANQITNDNLERLKKAGDRIAFLKEKMYYPQKVDDIFLNEDTNIFDIEAAKRQKIRLQLQDKTGTPVILHSDEGRIYHEFTDKLPITNFPLKPTDLKDAPVIIYEFPIDNPPYGLYVAGVDPYRQGQAKYSTSLGSVYIYKRMHDITGEKYQDMFVASYCARPDKKETWEEQSRLLIKYYNARTLCENDDISFIEYMKSKGDAHYLEKQPAWLQEVIPNTTVKREYGIHRSARKIIDYLHTCLKKYSEEAIYVEKDDDGNIIKEVIGFSKILDPMLLEEMIQYNDEGNFDRIIAAELAIAQALKMDPIIGKVGGSSDDRIKSLYSRKQKQNKLFPSSGSMLTNVRKNKLFR